MVWALATNKTHMRRIIQKMFLIMALRYSKNDNEKID
jgi:hypothetical protein